MPTRPQLSFSISLPGGVLYTSRIGTDGTFTPTFDHPSIRGDLVLTTDTTGHQAGALRSYDPYGQPLAPSGAVDTQNVPDNSPGSMDYGWLGQHQRPYELVQAAGKTVKVGGGLRASRLTSRVAGRVWVWRRERGVWAQVVAVSFRRTGSGSTTDRPRRRSILHGNRTSSDGPNLKATGSTTTMSGTEGLVTANGVGYGGLGFQWSGGVNAPR